MEALSREFRVALPWELLNADDLVVIAETEGDLIKRFNEWKDFVENRGMRVNHRLHASAIPVLSATHHSNWRFCDCFFSATCLEV